MKPLPISLLDELQHLDGFDRAAFTDAHKQPPATSVRINPLKQSGLFTSAEQVPWCNAGHYLADRPVFTLDPSYHAGAYYVQEASSMFTGYLFDNLLTSKKDLRVLDLCAAPGGKSTLIASLLDPNSLLVSNDVIRTRATVLEENMTRWGYMNTWVTCNDPKDFSRLPGYFDVMIVDAPCSGSGLFRKDEKAMDEWSEANVKLCSERQRRILADAWPALKENGILIYATCSYSSTENEEILDWLSGEFDVASLSVDVREEWGILTVSSPARKMIGYRFLPGRVKGEGFFIAALQKKESPGTLRLPRYKSINDKKAQIQAGYLLADPDALFIQTDKDNYSAIHPGHESDRELLSNALYLRKTGLKIGSPAAKEWLPAHDIALSIDASSQLPFINVDKDQALHFLKRDDINIPGTEKGWYIVRYNGLGLGWIKSLGNRSNNYLPKHWRIRMDITENE